MPRSLRNHDGDAEDNVDLKRKSFTLFATLKSVVKLIPEHSDKFETQIYEKLALVVHILLTT